jgi:hypothetical protein
MVIWSLAVVMALVAIDFVTASIAEYQVSSHLKTQLSLPEEPAVRINGFPFLTQAAVGDYRKVDVSAEYVGVGALRNVGKFAELYHVHVPLSELFSWSHGDVTVDSVASSVLITREDLLKLLSGVNKLTVSPVTDATLDDATINAKDAVPGSSVTGLDPTEAILLAGDTTVMGQKTGVKVIASMHLTDGQIEVTPEDIRLTGTDATQLAPGTQLGLRRAFSITINPGPLPFSLKPTRLRAVGDGISVSGTGRAITLAPTTQRSSN